MATDLKSQLVLLKTLQDIDISLHLIDKQLADIPRQIEAAMADFKAAKDAIAEKEGLKAKLAKRRKEEEAELEAHVSHVKEREAKLYAIKTNKEYQAAIKEIADAKQADKEKEESIFKLMEGMDTISKEITQLSQGLADKEGAFRKVEGELKEKGAALQTERDAKKKMSEEAESGVDPKVLKQYRFIQRRFSDAMAVASHGICTGCNKRIPPQVYIELQKWSELITCPNCHRMLFHEEPAASTEPAKKDL